MTPSWMVTISDYARREEAAPDPDPGPAAALGLAPAVPSPGLGPGLAAGPRTDPPGTSPGASPTAADQGPDQNKTRGISYHSANNLLSRKSSTLDLVCPTSFKCSF